MYSRPVCLNCGAIVQKLESSLAVLQIVNVMGTTILKNLSFEKSLVHIPTLITFTDNLVPEYRNSCVLRPISDNSNRLQLLVARHVTRLAYNTIQTTRCHSADIKRAQESLSFKRVR